MSTSRGQAPVIINSPSSCLHLHPRSLPSGSTRTHSPLVPDSSVLARFCNPLSVRVLSPWQRLYFSAQTMLTGPVPCLENKGVGRTSRGGQASSGVGLTRDQALQERKYQLLLPAPRSRDPGAQHLQAHLPCLPCLVLLLLLRLQLC